MPPAIPKMTTEPAIYKASVSQLWPSNAMYYRADDDEKVMFTRVADLELLLLMLPRTR
jgi:hypothetical protein